MLWCIFAGECLCDGVFVLVNVCVMVCVCAGEYVCDGVCADEYVCAGECVCYDVCVSISSAFLSLRTVTACRS